MSLLVPEKVAARHLERRAYVYVRQSTPKQVQQHQEGQRNQYALVQRARALGWAPERIQVIDADQGHSGRDSERRGFQELVAEVSLGHVGIILAYEASRLARNNADWYTLLDLASVVGALIADAEGIYDPRAYNDRLLLGLRGMLSEAEVHVLHQRMREGRLRQVERGDYRQRLPTGLLRRDDGRVIKDPDLQVQHTLELVFAHFAHLGSCQRVLRRLRDDGVLLPRRQWSGLQAGELVWRRPTDAAIYEILRSPAYAGAFVYGRHAPHPERRPGQTRMVNRPLEEWTAIHQGVYPAYISWEQFLANQARMSDNASNFAARTRGAPRQGQALLTGLVVCGRCGRQMRVSYKPQTRYLCDALTHTYARPTCQNLDGRCIEEAVVAAFFEALQPAELDLLEEVVAAQQADHARVAQHLAEQVRRAEYEARLAQRQYDAIDPDNRLVAAELERRWELALRAVVEAREVVERHAAQPAEPALDPRLTEQLRDWGRHLPELWASGRLSRVQQKELLRSLIRRVILTRPVPDTIEVKIVWISGAITPVQVHPPIHRQADLGDHDALVAQVVALSAQGYGDAEIAARLTAQGFRSARRRQGVGPTTVGKIRRTAVGLSVTHQFRSRDQIDGHWTVHGLARQLAVPREWLYERIRNGTLPAVRHPLTQHYLIVDDEALVGRLAAEHAAQRPRAPHDDALR
jgi:DNA invertase Pin-like site-specific DNA recombinase